MVIIVNDRVNKYNEILFSFSALNRVFNDVQTLFCWNPLFFDEMMMISTQMIITWEKDSFLNGSSVLMTRNDLNGAWVSSHGFVTDLPWTG